MASTQPNPSDLTNVLLLRLLQQNDSFGGSDPLAPVSNVSSSVVRAQSILFASLAVTLLAAFITILGRQWVLHYKETSYWGITADEDTGYQVKYVGLRRRGLHFIMESLPFLLQLALLLFGIGLTVYLWDLDLPSAEVILAVTCIECVFYTCTTVIATVRRDYPFQTPVSILLSEILRRTKKIRFKQLLALLRRRTVGLIRRETIPHEVAGDIYNERHHVKLSNPAFWRQDPLFPSPIPKDPLASVGAWLLENPTNMTDIIAAATAVAAEFSNLQWLSLPPSPEPLDRLYAVYMDCFDAPKLDIPTRLKALQSAAAYYVLYHSRLIWDASKSRWVEEEKLPCYLPSDLLLLHKDSGEWHGRDLFEYLLHIEDRSAPGTSLRFLSYIAPYWFCGDSDSAIKSRSSRLPTLAALINVLYWDTLTNCVLCVGAAMDFPLHPEDLIRVDKRYGSLLGALRAVLTGHRAYLVSTFEMVIEHIHQIIFARSRHYDYAVQALEILLTLVKNDRFPFIDAAWTNELLKRAVEGGVTDEHFTLFLRLSVWRKDSDDIVDTGVGDFVVMLYSEADQKPLRRTTTLQAPTPDDILFGKIMEYIQDRVKRDEGWQGDEDAVYGGLLAIRDIRRLEHSPFDDNTLQTLNDAMNDGNPPRVRRAVYDVMLFTQDQWLKSERLRQKLEDLDFFRQLHRVVEMARPNPTLSQSFLNTMRILSENVYWRSYVRNAMEIWLPLRHDGPEHIIRIISNVTGLPFAEWGNRSSSSLDNFLQQPLVGEWAAVPGWRVHDLTADRLKPLAEITDGFMELVFDDDHRRVVLAEVEQVIPGLERRHDSDYEGPGQDVCDIVNDLVEKLRSPPRRQFSDHREIGPPSPSYVMYRTDSRCALMLY